MRTLTRNDIEKELEVYESSFKKIENLDFLNIIDRSFYYLEIMTNALTEEQVEKNIKGVYNNLEQYKAMLLRKKRKQTYKKDKEDIEFKIDKINKFLFMEKLKNKYAEKNNQEKRGKI